MMNYLSAGLDSSRFVGRNQPIVARFKSVKAIPMVEIVL